MFGRRGVNEDGLNPRPHSPEIHPNRPEPPRPPAPASQAAPEPAPAPSTAPVPDDPPVLFRWRRVAHRVRLADGPERINGEWWRGSSELRDYYRVEDHDGRRFWLYRAGLYRPQTPARWFLHGVFA